MVIKNLNLGHNFFFTKSLVRFRTVHNREPLTSNIPDVFLSSEKLDLHVLYTIYITIYYISAVQQLLIFNITRCFLRASKLQSPTAVFCWRKTLPSIDYRRSWSVGHDRAQFLTMDAGRYFRQGLSCDACSMSLYETGF